MSAPPQAFDALIWVPAYICFTVASASYGATIGQLIFYVRAFPREKLLVKVLVFIVFYLLGVHSLSYEYLAELRGLQPMGFNGCHLCEGVRSRSFDVLACFNSALVSFYAHRVWIISGHSRVITFVVVQAQFHRLSLRLPSLVFPTEVVIDQLIRHPTLEVLSGSKYTPSCSLASAICDAVITSSVYYYLRPKRTGVTRRGNMISQLNFVFVQMGSLSFINALAMVVFYHIKDHRFGRYLTAAPGIILSNTYVNSMLAVLNARKSIRDQQDRPNTAIEVPTIPTIR
ncbi:hypothetical protein BDN67DRAFT_984747 [Paxillus ammoniavirescens]|nr:hypothetical protein BDN67DRAFT_984747 [Paxillus ammoniavirescens]